MELGITQRTEPPSHFAREPDPSSAQSAAGGGRRAPSVPPPAVVSSLGKSHALEVPGLRPGVAAAGPKGSAEALSGLAKHWKNQYDFPRPRSPPGAIWGKYR